MGTSYYINTTDKDFIKEYFINEYELTDEPYLSYEVQLCKCSFGWKTLFISHMLAYTSFKHMCEFLRQHRDRFELYDEYGDLKDVDSFIMYMTNRNTYTDDIIIQDHNSLGDTFWSDSEGYNFVER